MHMLNALIIDDELHCRENLSMLVEDFCPEVKVIGAADGASEAREFLKSEKVDMIFLDIMMPRVDGFEFLSSLEEKDFAIIFTTAHSEFALKAIKSGALDYLQKPIDLEELQQAVERARSYSSDDSKTQELIQVVRGVLSEMGLKEGDSTSEIAIPTRDGLEFVKHKNIIRLEGSESYTTIYLLDGRKFLSSKTIKVFESNLPDKHFIRVHRSHVINLNYLKSFKRTGGNQVVLQNGDQIPVARRKLSAFLKRVQSF